VGSWVSGANGLHDYSQIGATILGLAAQKLQKGNEGIADEGQQFLGGLEEMDGFISQVSEKRKVHLRLAGIFFFRYCRGQFQQFLRPFRQAIIVQVNILPGAEIAQLNQQGQ